MRQIILLSFILFITIYNACSSDIEVYEEVTPSENNTEENSALERDYILEHALASAAQDYNDKEEDSDLPYEAYLEAASRLLQDAQDDLSSSSSSSEVYEYDSPLEEEGFIESNDEDLIIIDEDQEVEEEVYDLQEASIESESYHSYPEEYEEPSSDASSDEMNLQDTPLLSLSSVEVKVSSQDSFISLMKEQILRDLQPVLFLIPKPVKLFLSTSSRALGRQVQRVWRGAFGGMLISLSRILRAMSRGLAILADHIESSVHSTQYSET